ncbi:hypothetical protein RQP46_006257 [Phenoliferia psychrophenolica]
MASPPPPAAPSAPTLKDEGNTAFRASDWPLSITLYTQALSSLATLTAEDAAALFSNRAAAYIHLFQFDRALLDTTAAIALRPDWSTGHARRAEVYARLHDFPAAIASYNAAITHSSTSPATLARHTSSLTLLLALQSSLHQSSLTPTPINYSARITALEKAGTTDFVQGGSVELVLRSYEWVEEGMRKVDEDVVRDQEGFRGKVPSGILDLCDAILTDPRGFHIPPGNDENCPLGEKLPLQYQYDIQVFANEKFLMGGLRPAEIVREFDARRKKEGWTKPRTALAHLIRGQILMAFVEEVTGAHLKSTLKYRFALELLVEGAEVWAEVSDTDRGTTFRPTFARGVKVALMLSLLEGWSRAPSEEERELFSLDEVMQLAEGIMDDCIANPAQPDPENATHWLAAQILPLVHAARSIAFVLAQRARPPLHNPSSSPSSPPEPATQFHDPGLSLAASKMYATAASYLPLDDPERPTCLFLSLSSALRAGGLTIEAVLDLASAAEAATPASEPVFGPVPRSYPARQLVRTVCAKLVEVVARDGESAWGRALEPQLGDLTRFQTERARLAAALSAAQIPPNQVKLIKYHERIPEAGDGEVWFEAKVTFEVTPSAGGEAQTLSVYYQYHCEEGITTTVNINYGTDKTEKTTATTKKAGDDSSVREGFGQLWLGDRKGYTGRCSESHLRDVMEVLALDLGKIAAVSSAAEKDAREQLVEEYCEAKCEADVFPEWSPQDNELIKVMEVFIPPRALHKFGWDLSFLEIVMWGVDFEWSQ